MVHCDVHSSDLAMAFCSFVTSMSCMYVFVSALYFGVICSFDIRTYNEKAFANPNATLCALYTLAALAHWGKWHLCVDFSQRPIISLAVSPSSALFRPMNYTMAKITINVTSVQDYVHYIRCFFSSLFCFLWSFFFSQQMQYIC